MDQSLSVEYLLFLLPNIPTAPIETCGILAIVHMVTWLSQYHAISSGSVYIGCDGLTALRRAMFIPSASRSCKEKHLDLLSAGIDNGKSKT